jgi:DNA-binding CsgD family transcriptional regulator/GAF domain-containing protein
MDQGTHQLVKADEALVAVTDHMGARLDPATALRNVLTTLSRLRAVTWVGTVMTNDPRTLLVLAANDAEPPLARYIEDMNPRGSAPNISFTLRVIETGEPVLVPLVTYEEFVAMQNPEVIDHLARNHVPFKRPLQKVGFVIVPMRTREATIGTLGIFDKWTLDPMTQDDVDWLQAIADRVAVIVDSAQVHAAADVRLNRLTGLRNVALAVAGTRDLRLTLQVIMDEAIAGLDVDAADVLVLDKADGMLRLVASTGFRTATIPEYRLPVDEELLEGLGLAQREWSERAPGESRRRTLFAREGFRSKHRSPLLAHGQMTGLLEVFSRSQLQPDQEWIDFVDALATQVAVAIDIAGLRDGFERNAQRPPSDARLAAGEFNRLETEILGLVVEGMSNSGIATRVHLSESTVKFHVHRILHKVGAVNRTELARKATKEGWV